LSPTRFSCVCAQYGADQPVQSGLRVPRADFTGAFINELKGRVYKRVVQTISYFPHFISTVVICGMITEFSLSDGLFNQLRFAFGAQEGISFLQETRYFRTIYTASGVWQSVGWGSIIYLASIAGLIRTVRGRRAGRRGQAAVRLAHHPARGSATPPLFC
jgi:hypothetical protein